MIKPLLTLATVALVAGCTGTGVNSSSEATGNGVSSVTAISSLLSSSPLSSSSALPSSTASVSSSSPAAASSEPPAISSSSVVVSSSSPAPISSSSSQPSVSSEASSVQASSSAPSDPAVARGKALYNEQKCSTCHGADGKGDPNNIIDPDERSLSALTEYLHARMPIILLQPTSCEDQCAEDVAKYIISWSGEPTTTSSASYAIPTGDCNDDSHGNPSARLLTAGQYTRLIQSTFSPIGFNLEALAAELPEDRAAAGFNNNGSAQISPGSLKAYIDVAEAVSETIANNAEMLVDCTIGQRDCREQFVRTYGERLYRHPISDSETTELLDVAEPVAGGREKFAVVAQALLLSPHTLYQYETAANNRRALTGFELADRLAFLIFDSAPDAQLLAAAKAGDLDTLAGVRRQAESMLDDSRAVLGLDAFYAGWLQFNGEAPLAEPKPAAPQGDQCNGTAECKGIYPDAVDCFDSKSDQSVCLCGDDKHRCDQDSHGEPGLGIALEDAYDEALRFTSYLTLEQNGTFQDLMTSRTAFVTKPIAPNYGLDASTLGRDDYRGGTEVDLGDERAGVLTRLAYLMHGATDHGSQPTIRGAFYRNYMLCQSFPSPDADVQDLFPTLPDDDTKTLVEKLKEFHLSVPGCAGCHTLLDPLGFGFENYDQFGAFRTEYFLADGQSRPVITDGEIYRVDEEPSDIIGTFDDAIELSEITANSAKAQACFAESWFRYAFVRYVNDDDQCSADKLAREFADGDFSLKAMILAVVESDAFRFRSADQ